MTERNLRIFHIHLGKEGGAERFFVNLSRGFYERGVEQAFFIRRERTWRDAIAEFGPVTETNIHMLTLTKGLYRRWITNLARKWQADVIFAWMSRGSKLLPARKRALQVVRFGDYPKNKEPFKNADCVIPNAPGIAEHCRALGWAGDLQIISNFPREVKLMPVDRAALNTPKDAFVICGAGRFVQIKGFDSLIYALSRLPNAYLWLVGDGPVREDLEALAQAEGVAERVRFVGWVDEAMHYISASDVFVIPSRHEPLGNVVLEAWYSGVPVVSTRSQGPSWFAEDQKTALMVEIDDVEGISTAISRVREDRALAKRLISGGHKKLASDFNRDSVIDQYLSLFASKGVKHED